MKLEFPSQKLRNLCEIERVAKKELGAPAVKKLKSRLADIIAAECVGDLMLGKPHPLKGDRYGQFSLTLHQGCRLVFEPHMDNIPTDEAGAIIWREVSSVSILFIGDYHD